MKDIEWRPIAGFEGRYEVNNNGEVKSFLVSANGELRTPVWQIGGSEISHYQIITHLKRIRHDG